MALEGRDLLRMGDLSPEEIDLIIGEAVELKAGTTGREPNLLAGHTVAMIFTKASTRTRVSFEAGVGQLGGHPIYLSAADIQLARGETIEDTGKVLSRYVDAIVIRTFAQTDVEGLAASASVPVINALTDDEHPCQILADLMTMRERFGRLEGLTIAYVGDGNNVAASLMVGGAMMGAHVVVASPPGYEPTPDMLARSEAAAARGGSALVLSDPAAAAEGADVVYTDTWASMGQEEERDLRLRDLAVCQVTPELMSAAKPEAVFMHCLPAHRGEEVTAEVIDGASSVVFDEAENRLHVQKALLLMLLGAVPS
jgi:ornithine carbamoyltransferase